LSSLFDLIIDRVPAPPGNTEGPFQMLVSTLDHSPYLGRLAVGRVERGSIPVGSSVLSLAPREDISLPYEPFPGDKQGKVAKLFTFEGLTRVEVPEVSAGDLI